jgi:hypothetical protein
VKEMERRLLGEASLLVPEELVDAAAAAEDAEDECKLA